MNWRSPNSSPVVLIPLQSRSSVSSPFGRGRVRVSGRKIRDFVAKFRPLDFTTPTLPRSSEHHPPDFRNTPRLSPLPMRQKHQFRQGNEDISVPSHNNQIGKEPFEQGEATASLTQLHFA